VAASEVAVKADTVGEAVVVVATLEEVGTTTAEVEVAATTAIGEAAEVAETMAATGTLEAAAMPRTTTTALVEAMAEMMIRHGPQRSPSTIATTKKNALILVPFAIYLHIEFKVPL